MNIKIAENIRKLRKENALTQEQLAEALGVTVGAVYKWEAGLSLPELKLIMEIADFFEISIDVLLGYEQQNGNVADRLERIRRYTYEKKFEEAVVEAEKTLQKYPNNFDVVYLSAVAYKFKFIENKNYEDMERSNKLFLQSITLLYQNTDPQMNETTIHNHIAENYLFADKPEEALKSLEENNVCGINSSLIGFTYAYTLKKPKEAWPFLLQSLASGLGNMIRTMIGISFMYAEQNSKEALEALSWLIRLLDSFKRSPEEIAFTDKYKAVVLSQRAVWYSQFGDDAVAEECIRDAYSLAMAYDAMPVYTMEGIRFLDKEEESVAYDSMGKTAVEAIDNNVFRTKNPSVAQRRIQIIWERLKNETEK